MTDKEIIEILRAGEKGDNQALRQLYAQNWPIILSLVRKNGGDEAQAKDIFQDTLITFYQSVKSNRYEQRSAIGTYLFAIARNSLVDEMKRKGKHLTFSEELLPVHEDHLDYQRTFKEEQQEIVKKLMNLPKEDCQEILRYTFFMKLSMADVAERMGFQNEQVARNKKHRCLGYLKKMIEKSAELGQILKDLR